MKRHLSQLLSLPGAFEEELVRLGRLEEGERLEHDLARGKYLRMGGSALAWPTRRSARPPGPRGTSFHFAHTTVAKPGRHPGAVPEAPTRDGRLYVYPGRGEVATARAAGAVYDRQAGAWHVQAGSHAAKELGRLATPAARAAWERRRQARGRSQRATPGEFQRYVERARLAPENRGEVEGDAAGPISLGSIGESEAERARFWEEVARRERRDGRVQCRIIAELPHEAAPQGRRRIVEEFVDAFAERGLPHHAAVHRPDLAKGMDPRNVHLHVVYHDRPAARLGRNRWSFAERKDRAARGPEWVRALRHRLAEAVNRELERESAAHAERGEGPITRRYDPRSYREMGVDKPPGRHLGPVAAAFDRSGRPTVRGVANALEDTVWEQAERGRALRPLAERWLALRERAASAASPAAASASALLEEARTAILEAAPRDPERTERLAQRRDWAAAECRLLETRIACHERRAAEAESGLSNWRGVVTGDRLERMRRRHRRVAEIEREAAALLAAVVAPAASRPVPVAAAVVSIARLLDRAERSMESGRAAPGRSRGRER